MPTHPATLALLRWFEHDHLPEPLRTVARPFATLAHTLADGMPHGGAELTTALRKLLEAKDCAVRAAIFSAGQE
ncbi:MAG: hypothetical protein ACLGI3_16775 [Actinomycetes bacterium]